MMIDGKTIELRNPVYSSPTLIDVEINHPDYGWIPYTANPDDVVPYAKDIYDRAKVMGPTAYVAPVLTQQDYSDAIQNRVDAIARARQYNDGATLAGYATDPNAAYAADASSFITWRSAVWVYVNAQLALVTSGQRSQPTLDQILSELPAPPWPLEES